MCAPANSIDGRFDPIPGGALPVIREAGYPCPVALCRNWRRLAPSCSKVWFHTGSMSVEVC